jgi:uncharacterized protein YigE (DUF2233 family)
LIAVRRDVMQETQRRQVPWEHSALTGKFYFSASLARPASAEITTSSTADNQASMTRSVTAVEVGDFTTHPAADEELTWLKIKIERNLVDFFVERGLRTMHRSSTLASSSGGATRIVGALERNSPTSVDLRVQLHGPDGTVVVSKTIEASLPALKEHYKSIPEALIHSLGVSPHTLRKSETSRVLTSSFPAMLLFLEAGRRAQLRQLDRASALLDEALKEDPRFAAAHWASAQLLKAQGNSADAQKREEMASSIDPDHTKTFQIGSVADPLPHLRSASQSAHWRTLAKSLRVKTIKLESYDIVVHAWSAEPADVRVSIAASSTPFGSTAAELRREHNAVLAVNGGFFDIDGQSRLSPTGLLITQGRLLNPASDKRKGGSGIIYSRQGSIDIDFVETASDLRDMEAAVQVGPLVVDPGGKNGIRRNDFDRQNRSVVCRQAGGTVAIIVITGGLSLYETGELLASPEADGGFGCDRALNLDGGPSTQASFAWEAEVLEIPGRWKVPNALLLVAR